MDRNEWIEKMVECLAVEEAVAVRVKDALAIKYGHRPKSVFKYRAIDEKGWSLRNLEDDCVWVCSPTDYNDPYDSSLSIETATLTKSIIVDGVKEFLGGELREHIDPQKAEEILKTPNPGLALQEFIMDQVDHIPPEQRAAFSEPLAKAMNEWETEFLNTLPKSHKSSLKVCSFCEVYDSIIMWSHYGDQHRGFCIEYDTQSLPPDDLFFKMMYPVIYSEKLFDGTQYYRAAIRNQAAFNMLFPVLAALYKSPEWSYEREWRLVIPANLVKVASPQRVPTPKRVYLGTRIPDDQREKVIKICKAKKIEVLQMRLMDDSFCLRAEPIVGAGK